MTDPVSAGSSAPIIVAAFDFDRTLTRRDTVVPFLRSIAGERRLLRCAARQGVGLLGDLLGRRRDSLKARATRCVFAGRAVAEVTEHADAYADRIARSWLRPDTLDRLRWHRSLGHRVVIVSASFEVYLHPVIDRLGIDAALGTRLVAADGRYTGEIEGSNCRGPEKVRRLEEWLGSNGLDRHSIELWAYGDSAGDVALLAAADHSIWATGVIGKVPVA